MNQPLGCRPLTQSELMMSNPTFVSSPEPEGKAGAVSDVGSARSVGTVRAGWFRVAAGALSANFDWAPLGCARLSSRIPRVHTGRLQPEHFMRFLRALNVLRAHTHTAGLHHRPQARLKRRFKARTEQGQPACACAGAGSGWCVKFGAMVWNWDGWSGATMVKLSKHQGMKLSKG